MGFVVTTEQEITREIETAAKSELDTVVRSIFDDPSASVVPGWIVGPLGSVSKGIGTLALLKVEGFAQTGGTKQGWSAVLKIMTLCAEGGVGQVGSVDGEVEAYRHGLFEDPSTGFRSARAYSITSKSADVVWLWTEDLSGYDGVPWSTEKYLQSAVTLGRKKGRLMGQSIQDYPWMNHGAGMDRWANPGIDKLFDVLATKRDSDYVRRALPKKCMIGFFDSGPTTPN
jgi:hypothetical protein